MSISIVMSTMDSRAELLERSLWAYTKQTYEPIEVIVVADRPQTTEIKKVVEGYQDKLIVKYFEIGGPPGWRNGYAQNRGVYEASGDIIVVTHSEIIMEYNAVQAIVDRLNNEDNVCVMLMWMFLAPETTEWLGVHPGWREDIGIIRNIVTQPGYGGDMIRCGFRLDAYMKSVLGAIEVAPNTSCTFWQSMAMMRKTWLKIGGFTLMNTWGSMDRDLQERKRLLGIPTRIVRALSYHQAHEIGPVGNKFEVFEYARPKDAIRELRWE